LDSQAMGLKQFRRIARWQRRERKANKPSRVAGRTFVSDPALYQRYSAPGLMRARRRKSGNTISPHHVVEATKGVRWMPWRQAPKKDVEHCDKPRGAVCRRYIRGCPNGETHPSIAR